MLIALHVKVASSFMSPTKIAHCFLTYIVIVNTEYNKGVLLVCDIVACRTLFYSHLFSEVDVM